MRGKILLFLVFMPCLLRAQPVHVLWNHVGATDSSRYGLSILPLGDQNDDGFADWAVFGVGTHVGNDVWVHQALEFFHGGPTLPTVPYLSLHIDSATEVMMGRPFVLGDLNGDGYTDWYTGCATWDSAWFYNIRLFYGGPTVDSTPDSTFRVVFYDARPLPVGDFNGDGFDDLLLYNWTEDWSHIYFGGNPMDTVPDWFARSRPEHWQETWPVGYGDVNGDGYSDFLGNSLGSTTAAIFLGGATPDTVPAYTWAELVGDHVTIVKDLNADGCDDIVDEDWTQVGRGRILWGRSVLTPVPDMGLAFPCGSSWCGPKIMASAGDFNADGYNDLLMYDAQGGDPGSMLTLHLGHPWVNPWPLFAFGGGGSALGLGGIQYSVGLGDVNGDGVDDIAASSAGDAIHAARGRVVILGGDRDYVAGVEDPSPALVQELRVSVFPNPFNSTTEIRYALPRSGHVSLRVFDVTGREVGVLVDEVVRAGEGRVAWKAEGVASGVYFVRLVSGEVGVTRKVLLVR